MEPYGSYGIHTRAANTPNLIGVPCGMRVRAQQTIHTRTANIPNLIGGPCGLRARAQIPHGTPMRCGVLAARV